MSDLCKDVCPYLSLFVWRQSGFAFFGAMTSVVALFYVEMRFYMKRTKELLVLFLSLVMLITAIGCDLSLQGDDSISQIDEAGKTAAQQISPVVIKNSSDVMVWIPRTGSKFHKKASCGNMQYSTQTTKQEAERRGYEPCKNCYFKE